jgi:5-enolpyruvylshikimate-3-phosphate synthase
VEHRPVRELIDELRAMEVEILAEVDALAEKLRLEEEDSRKGAGAEALH